MVMLKKLFLIKTAGNLDVEFIPVLNFFLNCLKYGIPPKSLQDYNLVFVLIAQLERFCVCVCLDKSVLAFWLLSFLCQDRKLICLVGRQGILFPGGR